MSTGATCPRNRDPCTVNSAVARSATVRYGSGFAMVVVPDAA
ncbi:hypothetical protein ACFQRB_03490 [Halobaculum litoreum]|uniref:Uncharacterized protein n=1 Tax=Halobaculum litoreum TaxID=3031998 RepID=A0ABD5XLM8_9EURY